MSVFTEAVDQSDFYTEENVPAANSVNTYFHETLQLLQDGLRNQSLCTFPQKQST